MLIGIAAMLGPGYRARAGRPSARLSVCVASEGYLLGHGARCPCRPEPAGRLALRHRPRARRAPRPAATHRGAIARDRGRRRTGPRSVVAGSADPGGLPAVWLDG